MLHGTLYDFLVIISSISILHRYCICNAKLIHVLCHKLKLLQSDAHMQEPNINGKNYSYWYQLSEWKQSAMLNHSTHITDKWSNSVTLKNWNSSSIKSHRARCYSGLATNLSDLCLFLSLQQTLDELIIDCFGYKLKEVHTSFWGKPYIWGALNQTRKELQLRGLHR